MSVQPKLFHDDRMATMAGFSIGRHYRYILSRRWGEAGDPFVTFIGLNPLKADEVNDDQTIRRMIGFAKRWGLGGIYVVNLFALVATVPEDMKAHPDPVGGPDTDKTIPKYASESVRVVACWGVDGDHMGRAAAVRSMLENSGVRLECFGLTNGGYPRHPVRLPNDTRLVPLAG